MKSILSNSNYCPLVVCHFCSNSNRMERIPKLALRMVLDDYESDLIRDIASEG